MRFDLVTCSSQIYHIEKYVASSTQKTQFVGVIFAWETVLHPTCNQQAQKTKLEITSRSVWEWNHLEKGKLYMVHEELGMGVPGMKVHQCGCQIVHASGLPPWSAKQILFFFRTSCESKACYRNIKITNIYFKIMVLKSQASLQSIKWVVPKEHPYIYIGRILSCFQWSKTTEVWSTASDKLHMVKGWINWV